MNVSNVREREQEIFDEWRKVLSEEGFDTGQMAYDGIADPSIYAKMSPKILFLLKEVNKWPNGDLRVLMCTGTYAPTWNNVARWTYGLHNLDREIPYAEVANVKRGSSADSTAIADGFFRADQTRKIAAINLKKLSGGATTNMSEIWRGSNRSAIGNLYESKLTYVLRTSSSAAEPPIPSTRKSTHPRRRGIRTNGRQRETAFHI